MPTFKKQERLCSKKHINELFETGNSFVAYPITIKWIKASVADNNYPAKVLFVASKKYFKSAVKRNKIKRLLRECYRQNKEILYKFLIQNNISIHFSVAYINKVEPDYHLLNDKMKNGLEAFIKQIEAKGLTENEKCL